MGLATPSCLKVFWFRVSWNWDVGLTIYTKEIRKVEKNVYFVKFYFQYPSHQGSHKKRLLSFSESWSGLAGLHSDSGPCYIIKSPLRDNISLSLSYNNIMAFAAARLLKDKQQKEQQLEIKKVFTTKIRIGRESTRFLIPDFSNFLFVLWVYTQYVLCKIIGGSLQKKI